MKYKNFPEIQKHTEVVGQWCRNRIKNYADKKGITAHAALVILQHLTKNQMMLELDAIVDPEYHSSNEPTLQLT